MNDLDTRLPNEVPAPSGKITPAASQAWASGLGERMTKGSFLAAAPDPPDGEAATEAPVNAETLA